MKHKYTIPKKQAICVRLKSKTLEEIDKICEIKEETRSNIIREIIEKTLNLHTTIR